MPELPEVETITRDLKKELPGLTIKKITIHGNYRPKAKDLNSAVGSKIADVERIGKTIHLILDDHRRLIFHLVMTGRLLLRDGGARPDPDQRVTFKLSDGKELRFTDQRMFGWVELLEKEDLPDFRLRFGPDPFELTPDLFAQRIASKKTAVKNALLEQSLVSGIGNIYANDALWMARIRPETKTTDISGKDLERLHGAVVEILKEGIEHRGSTLEDKMYVDIYGREGSHQEHFRVYGRAGEKCLRCEGKITFNKLGGRGTFYCEKCQVKSEQKGQTALGI